MVLHMLGKHYTTELHPQLCCYLKMYRCQAAVAHVCNPSYLGGRDGED
jgi:hypothetical protein